MVEFEGGKGLKLLGNVDFKSTNSHSQNSLGHLANSVHPLNKLPYQNARFDLKRRFSTGWEDFKISTTDYCVGDIGYFPLVANKDITAGEEIIVKYGKIYWIKLNNWMINPRLKTKTTIDRDNRMKDREKRKKKEELRNSSYKRHECKYEYEPDSSIQKAFPKSFYCYGVKEQN
jgi:hypothetical protein